MVPNFPTWFFLFRAREIVIKCPLFTNLFISSSLIHFWNLFDLWSQNPRLAFIWTKMAQCNVQCRPCRGRTILQLAESFSHGSKKRRKYSFFRNLSMASINPAPQYTPLHPHALTNPSHPQHHWNHRHQPYTSITKKDFTRPRHFVTL